MRTAYAGDHPLVTTPTGKLAHLLPPGENPVSDVPALCGQAPRYGTWAQNRDAAGLTVCGRCEHVAAT